MSDIQLYLLEYDKSKKEANRVAQGSAEKLQNKQLKLIDLIESLAEYINNDEPATRGRTMSYLAEVLEAMPPKVLSLQQRGLLCDFILSRIVDDTEGIGSCAKGLLALEERGQWDSARASGVMTTLIDHTNPVRQFRTQSERYPIVQLVDRLMAKYRDAIKNVHSTTPDFLSRFISYFDGEKDPRNLMIVFSILKVPMTEWDTGKDTQDLFDAVFNYFPITFKPPPDDPYGITAQDLKDRLRDCIASTSVFAPYSFPALLDKLDSTSLNTKRDVLSTLRACISNYGFQTISLYAITLWDALKFEILNVQEEDLATESLNCLAGIARQLSLGTQSQLNAYLGPIIKECNQHLEDAPTKQSSSSGRIVKSVAATTPQATNTVISGIVPTFFSLYHTADNFPKRRGLLEVFGSIMKADIEVYGDWRSMHSLRFGDDIAEKPPNAFVEYGEQALHLMSSDLSSAPVKEVSFRLTALDGLLQLSRIREMLSDDQISSLVIDFSNVVVTEESYGKDELKTAAISALVEIAHQKPQLVIDKAFPTFLANLPDTDTGATTKYVPVLEAFAKLADEDKLFQTVIIRLKSKLKAAVHQQASTKFLCDLLTAVFFAFTHRAKKMDIEVNATHYTDLVLPLLSQITDSQDQHNSSLQSEPVLDLVGRICGTIIRPLPLTVHISMSKEAFTLFRGVTNESVPPFSSTFGAEQRYMIVTTQVLASLCKEASPPIKLDDMVTALVKFCLAESVTSGVRAAALKQLSLVINKFIPNAELAKTLEPVLYAPMELLTSAKLNSQSIRVVFAIVKGLILRNSSLLNKTLPSLLEALSNIDYGRTIARGFSTLLQPDDLLTKENYCTVSGLHKQKTFNMLVPPIAASFRAANAATKTNYLIAVAGLLRYLPYNILSHDLSSLTPLLLQSLDLPVEEAYVKEASIGNIIDILTHNPAAIEEHANSVITRLLSTTDQKSNPTQVRAVALICLATIPGSLKQETTIPLRRQVVKRLTAALDDGKRSVRSEAVRCRSKWLDLDEEDEEE
ncbi:MMS19 nucleotide excision repair protein-like protein [Pseudovirgaria hyperparasitica]|uniref:MMS19 nucleotide excision repair protein n=1 Tax=Pseudovirgaria hyperparasitica TaxID=470096 RepID=A0A6A6W6N8_9PEZI|nr:MMS19 nucleotide excision repair protein-like protein [Pseudovirgaria hyperparasitica]KAF2756741.1 MMS19 nucleotide excision repair protein-like protein [Pseudovirgaria hyperparasitica]